MVEAKATCLDLKRWSSKDTCIHDQQSLNRVGFFNPNHINQFLVSVLVICQRRGISARPTNADNGSTKSPCSSWTRLSQREGDAKKESYEMLAWPRSSSGGSIFVVWHLKIQCHSVTCCSPTPPQAHWVSMALISVNSSSLTAAGDSGCHRTQVDSSIHRSSLEAEPPLQLDSHTTEQKSGRETLLNSTLRRFQKGQRPRSWGSPWASSILTEKAAI